MGHVSVPYRHKLVAHFVEDESGRRSNESCNDKVEASSDSTEEPKNTPVSNSEREHYPRKYDGAHFAGAKLGRHV